MKRINAILLIDDDEATNFINQLLIRKHDVTDELLVARNGKDAINLIQQFCDAKLQDDGAETVPKLIFLDINMPVMDGFGFLDAFERLNCPGKETAIIVILSTSLNPKDLRRIKEASSVKDFVSKPLTSELFHSLLEKHLIPS
ncbi:response regulator [Pontibacter vulgaris]|uniref:response regulator n=1 Tax=Pontibacter vulgaris TaxID=2905679 RepID=UPI001FA78A7C|nr:response regulator [Pontibacter vulgaris]